MGDTGVAGRCGSPLHGDPEASSGVSLMDSHLSLSARTEMQVQRGAAARCTTRRRGSPRCSVTRQGWQAPRPSPLSPTRCQTPRYGGL